MNVWQWTQANNAEIVATLHIPRPANSINLVNAEHRIFVFDVELSRVWIDGIEGYKRLNRNMRPEHDIEADQRSHYYDQSPYFVERN